MPGSRPSRLRCNFAQTGLLRPSEDEALFSTTSPSGAGEVRDAESALPFPQILLCSDLASRALFSKPGLYVRSSLLSARPALGRSPGRGSPLSSSPRVNALTTEACSRGVEQPEIRLIYRPKFHAIHTDQDLRCFSSVGGSRPGSPPSSSMKMRS